MQFFCIWRVVCSGRLLLGIRWKNLVLTLNHEKWLGLGSSLPKSLTSK